MNKPRIGVVPFIDINLTIEQAMEVVRIGLNEKNPVFHADLIAKLQMDIFNYQKEVSNYQKLCQQDIRQTITNPVPDNKAWRNDFENVPKNGDLVILRHTVSPNYFVLCRWSKSDVKMPWHSPDNNRFTENTFNQFFLIPQPQGDL